MKLDGTEGIVHLDFDIPNRRLSVVHAGDSAVIEQSLGELDLGTKKIVTEQIDAGKYDLHFQRYYYQYGSNYRRNIGIFAAFGNT